MIFEGHEMRIDMQKMKNKQNIQSWQKMKTL
jgi:hypothetical protein